VTQGHEKLIHSVAKVASVELRMANHSAGYTGCLAPKVTCIGFARASSAVEPSSTLNAPGVAFKILRDGKPSATLMGLWQSAGQTDTNFFLNPMSHHADSIPGGFSFAQDVINLKVLQTKFGGYDSKPNMIGISPLANMNPNGSSVTNVKSPFQLVLQPNPELKTLCDGHKGFDSNGTYKCLSSVAAGTTLYKIYAMDSPKLAPTTSDLVLIGSVVSTSNFSNSVTFDKYVQFGHIFWAQEVKNMGATGKNWDGATGGNYGLTAGAKKFIGVLPKF